MVIVQVIKELKKYIYEWTFINKILSKKGGVFDKSYFAAEILLVFKMFDNN